MIASALFLAVGTKNSIFLAQETGPPLTITYADLPKHVSKSKPSSNGRFKELKAQQKRLQEQAAGRVISGATYWAELGKHLDGADSSTCR